MHKPVFAVLTALMLGHAAAAGLSDAQALLDQGKWQDAATVASALKTAEGYALAAQAYTLGAALLPDNQKKAQFQQAQDLAKLAIKTDSNSANAHFELARADGRLAQYSGILQSLGLAGEVKRELETAINLNPNLAGAYVALGLWNAELTAKGFIATQATGARRDQIAPNFEQSHQVGTECGEPQNGVRQRLTPAKQQSGRRRPARKNGHAARHHLLATARPGRQQGQAGELEVKFPGQQGGANPSQVGPACLWWFTAAGVAS